MKKIPTLFKRDSEWMATPEVIPGFEWVLRGEGVATVKYDGSCTMIKDGKFYKRYDAKKGKVPPASAIPCQEKPDSVTGHWPHWVEVGDGPEDKWFREAIKNVPHGEYGTYEAVGEHFQGNPYKMKWDVLIPHGREVIEVERSFDWIRDWLKKNKDEGLVFWKDGMPQCKIKRSDFGFEWPVKKDE